jgi:hypothetical protein
VLESNRAAERPQRREYWVGASTAATLLATAVASGLLDRYLARNGFLRATDRPAEQRGRSGEPVVPGGRGP